MSFARVSGATSSLQWAQLVIFAVEVPVMTFCLVAHGANGALGWFFLQNFCLLRSIGYILVKVGSSPDVVKVGSILAQVALSTLYFGFLGVWHECAASTRYKRPFLFGWKVQIALHLVVAASTGLIIPGALQAFSNAPTPSNPKPGDSLVIGGVSMFIVSFIGFCILVAVLYKTPGKLYLEKKLLLVLAICTPLLGIRTLYSLLGAAIDDSSWSFLTGGTIAEQLVLAALPEFIIIIALSIAGIVTRHLSKELAAARGGQRNRRMNSSGYEMGRAQPQSL